MATIAYSSPSEAQIKPVSKPKNIFRRKEPIKKSSGAFTPNLRFRLKMPFTHEKLDTERIYANKCKTEAIERTLQDDRFLLFDGRPTYNEFMADEPEIVNSISIGKIKRQLNTLDRIEKRMSRRAQEEAISDRPVDQKVHQRIISNTALPPLNPKVREINGETSSNKKDINEVKVI